MRSGQVQFLLLFLSSYKCFTGNKFCTAGVLKRMCTSCKCCKLRDEDTYINLDDEKKHFLVLMMGDFQDAMVNLFKYSSTLKCYKYYLCAIVFKD
jgi:hypothetical protein